MVVRRRSGAGSPGAVRDRRPDQVGASKPLILFPLFLWGAGALDRDCGSAPSGVLREAAVIQQRPETE